MNAEHEEDESLEDGERTPFTLGLIVFGSLIAALFFIGFSVRNYMLDEQKLPIQQIVFTGELNALDPNTLEQRIRQNFRQSFFSLDVNHVHDSLQNEPWIYRVSVRKRWPNALLIHVVEQEPVAFWNAEFLLNKYGETYVGKPDDMELPRLYGPEGSEKTALTGYTNMQSLLDTSQQRIDDLYLSERFSWQVKLRNDVLLKLGRQEYVDRLQRYIDHYPVIVAQQKPIKYIDLRYDTGMAVGWEAATTDVEADRIEM
ncbi:MAG: cell division protein FtsQ/DivIB [Pseudomonadota bacterium]